MNSMLIIALAFLMMALAGNARCQTTLADHESREERITIVRHEKGTHGYDYTLRQQRPELPDPAAITMFIRFKPLYSSTLHAIKVALLEKSDLAEFSVEQGGAARRISAKQIGKITRIQAVGVIYGSGRMIWLSVQLWGDDLPPYTIDIGQIRELEDYFNEVWEILALQRGK